MKLLTVTHKNISYEFRLLERTQVVEITKAGKFSYIMRRTHSGLFYCNCPGARFNHKCWHPSMMKFLNSQQSVTEDWASWAEEGGEMEYGKQRI